MATGAGFTWPESIPSAGAGVGFGIEAGIDVATGVANTGGAGGWGVLIVAMGVGTRVGWAGTGSGVERRASVGSGAVAGTGWPVSKAGFGGWLGLAAWAGSAGAMAGGKGSVMGDDGVEPVGDAPEPEAVDAECSAE